MKTHGLFRVMGAYLQITHKFKQYIVNEKFCILYNISNIYIIWLQVMCSDLCPHPPLLETEYMMSPPLLDRIPKS